MGSIFFDYVAASDTLAFYDYHVVPRILKSDIPVNISDVKFTCNMTKLENIKNSRYSICINESELFNSIL